MSAEPLPVQASTPRENRFLWLSYVGPFALYLILTQFPPLYPDSYAWTYPAVVVVVGAATVAFLHGKQILRPHRHVAVGIAAGVVGIALWIFLSRLHLERSLFAWLPEAFQPKARAGFDPFTRIADPSARWGFVGFRLAGLVLVVPVAEELFWRGFLLRWLISPNWQELRLGQFSWFSFAGVVVLFTLAHPEWFAAAVYCALLNGLMIWKRDLWNCVVAHAISNLILAVYILSTQNWELW